MEARTTGAKTSCASSTVRSCDCLIWYVKKLAPRGSPQPERTVHEEEPRPRPRAPISTCRSQAGVSGIQSEVLVEMRGPGPLLLPPVSTQGTAGSVWSWRPPVHLAHCPQHTGLPVLLPNPRHTPTSGPWYLLCPCLEGAWPRAHPLASFLALLKRKQPVQGEGRPGPPRTPPLALLCCVYPGGADHHVAC